MTKPKHIRLAVIAGTVALLLQPLGLSSAASAKHFVDRQPALPQESNLLRLKRADSLWSVLDDAEVKTAMKKIMVSAVEKYYDATQISELPSVEGNELYSAGGVRGRYTVTESFFDLDLVTKKLCIIVLNDSNLNIYGVETFDQLPPACRAYIEDLQSRISGILNLSPNILAAFGVDSVDQLPQDAREQFEDLRVRKAALATKLKIKFKQPALLPSSASTTASRVTKKKVKVSVLTGTYSRVDSDPRFEKADFRVVRLSGKKIKFCCTAFSGSHSGAAAAVVPIVNNTAEFNESDCKLTMQFDGKYVYVAQEGDGFGGIGVTAAGKYEKIDDHTPQIEAERE